MARIRRTPARPDDRGRHAAVHLPGLDIDAYSLPVRDPQADGFIGDRASQTAFRGLVDAARQHHLTAKDPFGRKPSRELKKDQIDLVLVGGGLDASHAMHLAVEEYARQLCYVVQVFMAQRDWAGVERIVIGGGFPEHQTGGLAMRRAIRLLELADTGVGLLPLRHDPDEGGLLGWSPLLPREMHRYDAFLAVDIGGTKLRCGIVQHRLRRDPTGGHGRVLESMVWRHKTDRPDREAAVRRTAAMLNGLAALARTLGLALAPFVGIACPGTIEPDGSISAGAQNLPGEWERPFHLPEALAAHLDRIDGQAPAVVMHNDAVVQGLSELDRMLDVRRWAILTIGTGLGNATYTTR
jgi:Transcriptional regulator/sugar kinase